MIRKDLTCWVIALPHLGDQRIRTRFPTLQPATCPAAYISDFSIFVLNRSCARGNGGSSWKLLQAQAHRSIRQARSNPNQSILQLAYLRSGEHRPRRSENKQLWGDDV